MIKTVTFGYRWEGLALHQWAFTHTDLLSIVVPANRTNLNIENWAIWFRVPLIKQENEEALNCIEQLKLLKPDIILCHCYTYKLAEGILEIPRLGCINIHPGKLPEYKGRKPIEDAMDKGDAELWGCLHYMDENFDTGKVIIQAPVKREDDLQGMRSSLTKAGLRLLEKEWGNIT